MTPNPNKCTHGFSGFKHKIAIISIPRGVVTENSSDLDSGRRPKLRSVEFFVTTPLVIEIRGRLFVTFPDFVYTYWDSESLVRRIYRGVDICQTVTSHMLRSLPHNNS